MKFTNLKELIDKVEYHKTEIGKHRDELRKIEGLITDVLDGTNRGLEALSFAIDALSEHV